MNEPSVGRQASYEISNVLSSSLLNDLDPSILEQRCRLMFERGNSRVASRFNNFFDSYDNTYGSGLLGQHQLAKAKMQDFMFEWQAV
jgi:hypothetical protein